MTGHTFENADLGFSARIPEGWSVLPTPWALQLRNRADPTNEELQKIMQLASVPFVYAQLPHGDPRYAFPTFQASCRVLQDPSVLHRAELLEHALAQQARTFPDLEVIEATPNAMFGGRPATRSQVRFTILNESGDEFECSSFSYLAISGRLAFAVGLSCAASGPYCVVDDLMDIARSVRIV